MINFAHRGASFDFPENTILSLRKAIECGATGLEIDVHKTKDNKIVVIHDEDIERTFLGKGLVEDFTYEELKKFKNRKVLFRDNEECYIPLLEEVLNLVKEAKVMLNIELKTDEIEYHGIEDDVINMIKKYGLEKRVILSSFNHNSIKRCKDIDSSIKTGVLYCKEIENVIEYAKSLKADAIHPDLRLVTKSLIDEAHKNGIIINIYTVNSPIYMRELIELGADGIFTDYPELLESIIKKKKWDVLFKFYAVILNGRNQKS